MACMHDGSPLNAEFPPLPLAILFDQLQMGLIAVDDHMVIRNVNTATEKLFGKTRRYMQGENLGKLLPGHPVALDLIQRSQNLHMPCRIRKARINPAPGVFFAVSLTAIPLRDANSDPCGTLLQLEEVGAAEQLEEEQQLDETLDSLGNMAMVVAHEIKNPLAGIRGAAQLLEMEATSPAAVTCTQLIREEVDRVSRLLDSLLGLADDPLLLENELNIHEILSHVSKVCCQHNALLAQDFDPSLPTIRGDRDQLIQLFLNLTQNAAEAVASQKDGRVRIHTRISERIRFEQGRRIKQIIVEIHDNGPGINSALRKRIFLPFVTSKAKGTGLGLPISRKIVHDHGGLIEVESRPGRTVFRVYLPVAHS